MRAGRATFDAALEAVAANTVFTTHTPVPAGHDHFSRESCGLAPSAGRGCGWTCETLLALGAPAGRDGDFNMTALAIRGSRFQNGVSRIHGGVSSRICADSGRRSRPTRTRSATSPTACTCPTFLAPEWAEVFERFLGFDWTHRLDHPAFWQRVDDIPTTCFWSVRQSLKARMLHLVRHRVRSATIRATTAARRTSTGC